MSIFHTDKTKPVAQLPLRQRLFTPRNRKKLLTEAQVVLATYPGSWKIIAEQVGISRRMVQRVARDKDFQATSPHAREVWALIHQKFLHGHEIKSARALISRIRLNGSAILTGARKPDLIVIKRAAQALGRPIKFERMRRMRTWRAIGDYD